MPEPEVATEKAAAEPKVVGYSIVAYLNKMSLESAPIIFCMVAERTHARSFYIGSCQNYREAQCGTGQRCSTIYMKRKHLYPLSGSGAFGTQTVTEGAGP